MTTYTRVCAYTHIRVYVVRPCKYMYMHIEKRKCICKLFIISLNILRELKVLVYFAVYPYPFNKMKVLNTDIIVKYFNSRRSSVYLNYLNFIFY